MWITWPVSIMEPEPGEYGEWVSAVWGGRGYPGESLIGTRECGSYAAHAWAVAALSSLACLGRRRFGFSGSAVRKFSQFSANPTLASTSTRVCRSPGLQESLQDGGLHHGLVQPRGIHEGIH